MVFSCSSKVRTIASWQSSLISVLKIWVATLSWWTRRSKYRRARRSCSDSQPLTSSQDHHSNTNSGCPKLKLLSIKSDSLLQMRWLGMESKKFWAKIWWSTCSQTTARADFSSYSNLKLTSTNKSLYRSIQIFRKKRGGTLTWPKEKKSWKISKYSTLLRSAPAR